MVKSIALFGTSADPPTIGLTKILEELCIRQPLNGIARNQNEAEIVAKNIGFPLVVRPSYVLGGRAMEIVKDENELSRYISEAVKYHLIIQSF